MMKNKQIINTALFAVACVLILGSCFSDWQLETSGTGTITISFNNSGSSAASRSSLPPWPPLAHDLLGNIEYEITLFSRAGESIPTFTAKSGDTISRVVSAGLWTIKIDAYLQGAVTDFSPEGERIYYATGSRNIQVIEGRDNPAAVQMFPICQDCGKYPCDCALFNNVFNSLSARSYHTAAIDKNGSLWVWGRNEYGQLGDGTTVDRHIPVQIGASKWLFVSAGNTHTVAIKEDKSLWAWGNNQYGALGDGTTTQRLSPVQIGADKDWAFVAAAGIYTIAIKEDKSLWAWGDNQYGVLGDGTMINKNAPVQIGSDKDWVFVSVGNTHTVAMKEDKSLWAWGLNRQSQVGDGTTVDRRTPVQVGTDRDWVSVSAGHGHNFAIKTDGSLWAWGYNNAGQLGDGTTSTRRTPVQIGTDTDWVSASGGPMFTVAIKKDKSLWAWGIGLLGDDTITNTNVPIQIGNDKDWSFVYAATDGGYNVAIKTDNSLWAWGGNSYGQLGDGTTETRSTPVRISTGSSDLICKDCGKHPCSCEPSQSDFYGTWGDPGGYVIIISENNLIVNYFGEPFEYEIITWTPINSNDNNYQRGYILTLSSNVQTSPVEIFIHNDGNSIKDNTSANSIFYKQTCSHDWQWTAIIQQTPCMQERTCTICDETETRHVDAGCTGTLGLHIYTSNNQLGNNQNLNASVVCIPDTATSIINSSFLGNSYIQNVRIGAGISFIEGYAFASCENLTTVTFASNSQLVSIGDGAFNNCTNLTNLTIPQSVVSIGSEAFRNCVSFTSITIPESVTVIEYYAFGGCTSLTNITIPANLSSINSSVFAGCVNLVEFSITGSGALSAYDSGKGLMKGNELIAYPSASGNLILPSGLERIGNSAFSGDITLTSISIPASVTHIDTAAFAGSYENSLATVIIHAATPPSLGYDIFMEFFWSDTLNSNIIIQVPASSLTAYRTHPDWIANLDDVNRQIVAIPMSNP